MNRSFGQDPRTKESAFPVRRPSGVSSPMPVTPALGYPKQQGLPLQHKNVQTRPETCEKAMIRLLQKHNNITTWQLLTPEEQELERRAPS
ncbi:hypothetical protein Fmac_026465 [Flemingia macrophylla]|uniref:Uncharacterized protein n=1 Tax=Flemingia macrophylla TaxID=520843 RepID=A0ABD1LF34_9FABA